MKPSSLAAPASTALLLTAALILASPGAAQTPQAAQPNKAARAQPGAQTSYPAPTNLKVLPKNLTGAQVRDIMRNWAGALGVKCDDCHTPIPGKMYEGKPALNFADDSKPEKEMARIMYRMTEDMKANYISKVEAMDTMPEKAPPLTCGTCHRGKEDPSAFVIPKQNPAKKPQSPPMSMPMGK